MIRLIIGCLLVFTAVRCIQGHKDPVVPSPSEDTDIVGTVEIAKVPQTTMTHETSPISTITALKYPHAQITPQAEVYHREYKLAIKRLETRYGIGCDEAMDTVDSYPQASATYGNARACFDLAPNDDRLQRACGLIYDDTEIETLEDGVCA